MSMRKRPITIGINTAIKYDREKRTRTFWGVSKGKMPVKDRQLPGDHQVP
jgi:hypothetical protein